MMHFNRNSFVATLAAVASGFFGIEIHAGDGPKIEFIGKAVIPGDARDLSGDARILENGEPRNRLGGFSALDYSGRNNIYAAMSDRGPDDGAVGYPCRVQMLEIQVSPKANPAVSAKAIETIMFSDEKGRPFTGLSAAVNATAEQAHRFDPEGFRFSATGSFFVSDEYGPELVEFSAQGRAIQRLSLPSCMRVQNPHGDKLIENSSNKIGRASNRGMECLAISHDGTRLIGLMQGPLIQDGVRTPEGIIVGRNCRLVEYDLKSGHLRQFVYQMASDLNGNSEIVAYGPDQYLVLERDSGAGEAAAWRKLVLIDVSKATELGGREYLPLELPTEIVPVARHDFLDFLDPQWKLSGPEMPEKIEGLTFGPKLADGRSSLLVSTDNDFESAEPSQIWVFAIQN